MNAELAPTILATPQQYFGGRSLFSRRGSTRVIFIRIFADILVSLWSLPTVALGLPCTYKLRYPARRVGKFVSKFADADSVAAGSHADIARRRAEQHADAPVAAARGQLHARAEPDPAQHGRPILPQKCAPLPSHSHSRSGAGPHVRLGAQADEARSRRRTRYPICSIYLRHFTRPATARAGAHAASSPTARRSRRCLSP